MTYLADPLAAPCRHCRARPGDRCRTWDLRPARPHKARVSLALVLAAHSDPALDEYLPDQGPCGLCGTCGLGARHRRVDAIACSLAAGEDAETCAYEYGCSLEAVLCVAGWMQRWDGAWT